MSAHRVPFCMCLVFAFVLTIAVPASAQTLPPPVPDALGPPNVFYGAVPPVGKTAPVLLFVHGLNGMASDWWDGNDMYTLVYASGFRSAFVSLSLDNTRNNRTIAENGAMLKTVIPTVAKRFGVTQLYVITHSKGSLDTQSALLDRTVAVYVKAVFAVASPNQGSELADWAFGPGKQLAGELGLLTPAVFDLRLASVAAFRAQVDPVLTGSEIQFYTIPADTFFGNPVTVAMGAILQDLAPEQPGFYPGNDGLVTVARNQLPTSYSFNIGVVHVNHFEAKKGSISFPLILERIQVLEQALAGFRRIATGGFGDPSNEWAWSMKWFKGKLYVGTGRHPKCVSYATSDVQSGTNVYPPPGSGCPNDTRDLRLRAEIWRYTPETKAWERVYQSPQDIQVGVDDRGNPKFTARDIGYRGMAIFREADGTDALYVAGVNSGSIFEKIEPYPTIGFPPPRMLRTVDGVTWSAIPQDPGTFMGDIFKLHASELTIRGFRSMMVFNGLLLATATDYRGVGIVIASRDPSKGNDAWFRVSPDFRTLPVWTLEIFNGFLYCTTGMPDSSSTGYGVYKTSATGTPPFAFVPIITDGAGMPPEFRSPNGLSMQVFKGRLYVGTNRPTEMVRLNPDDTWDLVVGQPRNTPQGMKFPISGFGEFFGNYFSGHFWEMGAGWNGIHMGTWDWSIGLQLVPVVTAAFAEQFGCDLMRSQDGVSWSAVTSGGLGDGHNYGGRSFENSPFGLFFGTARDYGGCQVWLDSSVLDLNTDGIIDQADVGVITAARNTPAKGGDDPRDIDRDGTITVLDARKLVLRCTNPGCATTPRPPARPAAPAGLKAASEFAVGRQVILSWTPVTGAVKYRVYRTTVKPLLDLLPPEGITINIPNIGPVTIPQDILGGRLDQYCKDPAANDFLCVAVQLVKAADALKTLVGLPAPTVLIGEVAAPTYTEQAPTPLQSIYFVRAVDAQGNLSPPSNVVGGPSKAFP